MSIKSSKIKYLYTYYLSKLRCLSNELLQIDDVSDNKSTYRQYNTAIRTLLLGIHHDAVSGWLLLASFFYRRKEYKTSFDIIQYCLFKCTPEKIYRGMNLSNIHKKLLNMRVCRKMHIVQLSMFLLLGFVEFPILMC